MTQSPEACSSLSDTALVRWLVLDEIPETAWPRWLAILDDEETARAARFLREADRRQFIAAHVLVRVMLQEAAGLPPQHWRFIRNAHGKPALHPDHGRSALLFNISHSRGAVACGIAQGCPIGVDIEDEPRGGDHLGIAEAYFAPSEVARLRATPEAARPALFLLLWTLKEAYIKAVGLGLSMPLDRFAFAPDPIAISFSEPAADCAGHWQFDSFHCAKDHRLSVALRTDRPIPLRRSRMSYGDVERLVGGG